MHRRSASETQALLALRCPTCRGSLSVVTSVRRLTFHCPQAHAFDAEFLLGSHSGTARRSLDSVVAAWEQKAVVLREVSAQARRDGYPEVADNFEREAARTDARLHLLRKAFLAEDSTTVLRPQRKSESSP